MRRRAAALVILMVVHVAAAACGGGPEAGETASPTRSPAGTTAQAPGAGPADGVIDLATAGPLVRIDGAGTGDYFNDLPALVSGDVNGDGLADLLLGARFADGPGDTREDAGEAYLILGKKEMPATIDLAVPEADVTVYGAVGKGRGSQQGDQLGFAGALGDVNGDGLDDVILGAPFAQRADSGAMTGKAYVIFGKRSLPRTIDLAETKADLTLVGGSASSFFGDAVAVTDANGDGYEDIIVGAPFAPRPADRENPGKLAGAVYVFRGGAGLSGERDVLSGEFDLVIYGEEEHEGGDEAGDNVAGGDLNGDGIGDIVITAEAADGPDNARSVAAEVYVVYGRRDLGGVLDVAAGDQDVTVYGAEQNDTLGFNIAVADVTGDGTEDLLVSARGGDGKDNRTPEGSEVHVFPGGRLPAVIDLADYPDDAYLYGADPADFLGNGMAAADFDGDGVNELIVGAPGGDGASTDPVAFRDGGEAYVVDVRGLQGGVRVVDAPVRLAVYGARPDDALGTSVAAGDVDGDGKPELALLAIRSDGPGGERPDAGTLYVVKTGSGQ